jgi:hypothetical protein
MTTTLSVNPNWVRTTEELRIIEMMADGFDQVDSKIQAINDNIESISDSIGDLRDVLGDTNRLQTKSVMETLNTIVELLEQSQANVSIAMQG